MRGSVGGDSYFSERSYEHKLDFEQDLGVTNMNNAPEVKITHGKLSLAIQIRELCLLLLRVLLI